MASGPWRCRPGDVAWVARDLWCDFSGGHRAVVMPGGLVVRVLEIDPQGQWRLEQPRPFTLMFATNLVVQGCVVKIHDRDLRPLQAPEPLAGAAGH